MAKPPSISDDIYNDHTTYFMGCRRATVSLVQHHKIDGPGQIAAILVEALGRLKQLDILDNNVKSCLASEEKRHAAIRDFIEMTRTPGYSGPTKIPQRLHEGNSDEISLYIECMYVMAFRCYDISRWVTKELFKCKEICAPPIGVRDVRNLHIFHPEKNETGPSLFRQFGGSIGEPGDYDFSLTPVRLTGENAWKRDQGTKANLSEFREFWFTWIDRCFSRLQARDVLPTDS